MHDLCIVAKSKKKPTKTKKQHTSKGSQITAYRLRQRAKKVVGKQRPVYTAKQKTLNKSKKPSPEELGLKPLFILHLARKRAASPRVKLTKVKSEPKEAPVTVQKVKHRPKIKSEYVQKPITKSQITTAPITTTVIPNISTSVNPSIMVDFANIPEPRFQPAPITQAPPPQTTQISAFKKAIQAAMPVLGAAAQVGIGGVSGMVANTLVNALGQTMTPEPPHNPPSNHNPPTPNPPTAPPDSPGYLEQILQFIPSMSTLAGTGYSLWKSLRGSGIQRRTEHGVMTLQIPNRRRIRRHMPKQSVVRIAKPKKPEITDLLQMLVQSTSTGLNAAPTPTPTPTPIPIPTPEPPEMYFDAQLTFPPPPPPPLPQPPTQIIPPPPPLPPSRFHTPPTSPTLGHRPQFSDLLSQIREGTILKPAAPSSPSTPTFHGPGSSDFLLELKQSATKLKKPTASTPIVQQLTPRDQLLRDIASKSVKLRKVVVPDKVGTNQPTNTLLAQLQHVMSNRRAAVHGEDEPDWE